MEETIVLLGNIAIIIGFIAVIIIIILGAALGIKSLIKEIRR